MIQSRLLITFFAIFIFENSLFGQQYFQKTYNNLDFADSGNGAEVLPNGDVLTAGIYTITDDPVTIEAIWIQRLNAQGTVLWSKIYAGNSLAAATDIQRPLTGGGFWVAFNSPAGAIGQTQGGWLKISDNGDVLFSQKDALVSEYKKILPLSDGGILLIGSDDPTGWLNAVALKINATGSVQWKTSFGGSFDDAIESCWEDAEGFIYCSGYSTNFSGNRDGMLAQLSPSGDVLWARRYGSGASDQFTGIAPFTSDSSLLLAGYSNGFGADNQVWLAKVTWSGVLKWSRTYSVPGQDMGAIDLVQIPGSQFLIAASDPLYQIGSPAILFKISQDGDLLWEYEYKTGGERAVLREVLPASGGFAAVGSSTLNGDESLYVLKVAADGLIPGSDCCPASAGLMVTNVIPQTEPFTPGSSGDLNTTIHPLAAADIVPEITDICTPIDLAFSVSDSSICPGECVDITVTGNTPGVTYTISTPGGVPDPDNPLHICYPNEDSYLIIRKGENSVCSKDLSIKIEVGNRSDAFPNAFTPNGDGVNDTFKPLFFCPVLTTSFKIYNRWGQKVFETRDPNAAWDGKVDGTEAPSDVYAWQVEYEVLREGQQRKLMGKGDVTLLR
jgi:gliding motility-associated-like protein